MGSKIDAFIIRVMCPVRDDQVLVDRGGMDDLVASLSE
jgi:hypothetical protein